MAQSGREQEQKANNPQLDIPNYIGGYDIGQCIGRGAFGSVYQAHHRKQNRNAAIKVLLSGLDHSSKKQKRASEEFHREAELVGKLRHEHIISLYDQGIEKNLYYLIMEYVPGTQLSHYAKADARLPLGKMIEIIYESALALDYAHRQGVIHRDIKPSNIMLTEKGVTKVLDFGIAISSRQNIGKRSTALLGTPNYMSPEQVLGKSLGPQSDLYSLATVLFELLTCKLPYQAKNIRDLFRSIIMAPTPKLSSLRPDLPPRLSLLLAVAMDKQADRRHTSLAEFAEELASISDGLHSEPPRTENLRQILEKVPAFSHLPESLLLQVCALGELLKLSKGKSVRSVGSKNTDLYLIHSGVLACDSGGRIIRLLGAGDYCGERGFSARGAAVASTTRLYTASSAQLYRLPQSALALLPNDLRQRCRAELQPSSLQSDESSAALPIDYIV